MTTENSLKRSYEAEVCDTVLDDATAGSSTDLASTRKSRNTNHSHYISLGHVKVAQIAIGTLAMGVSYPDPNKRPTEAQCMDIIEKATLLSPHVFTLFDTADTYSPTPSEKGYMEAMLARAFDNAISLPSSSCDSSTTLASSSPFSSSSSSTSSSSSSNTASSQDPNPIPNSNAPESLKRLPIKGLIATKGGMLRVGPDSIHWRSLGNFHPSPLIRDSATRLGNHMFLWQAHHWDKAHPIQPMLQEVQDICNTSLHEQGCPITQYVGLCNVTLDQIKQATIVFPSLATVQNNFNFWLGPKPFEREMEIIQYCKDHGLVYMAYGVFGGLKCRRGELSLEQGLDEAFYSLARRKQVSPYGLLLGCLINKWNHVMPIVGMRSSDRVRAIEEAYKIELTAEEIEVVFNMRKKGRKKNA